MLNPSISQYQAERVSKSEKMLRSNVLLVKYHRSKADELDDYNHLMIAYEAMDLLYMKQMVITD